MASGLGLAPALPRLRDGGLVVAVEHVANAGEALERRALHAIDENEHGRTVGIALAGRQEDRLALGIAVARAAMRQEARLVIGPEQLVQILDALVRARHHQHAIAVLEGALQEPRQRALERRGLQMIEADLAHLPS